MDGRQKKGYKVIRNNKGEILHLVDSAGEKLAKKELDAIVNEYKAAGPKLSKEAKGILDQLPGKTGKTGPIKEVPNDQALKDLFDTLSKEGKTVNPGTYPGVVKELPDGTIVRMRPGSKSGGATLDITMLDGKIYKVHIQ